MDTPALVLTDPFSLAVSVLGMHARAGAGPSSPKRTTPPIPSWNEQQTTLQPAMAARLRYGQRVQVVRDGAQAALALVTAVKGPAYDSGTTVAVHWRLAETPHGNLVAYYQRIAEPGHRPSTLEAFLPVFCRASHEPLEGAHLLQHLACARACFVVCADGPTVMLNRRVAFDETALRQIRQVIYRLAALRAYPLQHRFRKAQQWHRANFDMCGLPFDGGASQTA
jgi:hypothetical protein